MAKGIKGHRIHKLKRIDDNTIVVEMKSGEKIEFKAVMCGYDECRLISYEVDDSPDYYDYGDEW